MERTTDGAVERELEALAERVRASTVAIRLGRGGAGSGVVWAGDGTIVTNAHVASGPRADVVFGDGRRFEGRVERRDERRDLALVRIDADDLTPAETRDPSDLRIGEVLVAVGHPLGIPNALTMGIAHAAVTGSADRFVQADLMLAPGNSGGPLADVRGRVVGINSMVVGGLALAVPTSAVQRFLGTLGVPAPLGVRLAPARLRNGTPALAIVAIEPGSRADRAGLLVGDLLPAREVDRLRFAPALNVIRGGSAISVPIPAGAERDRAA